MSSVTVRPDEEINKRAWPIDDFIRFCAAFGLMDASKRAPEALIWEMSRTSGSSERN